MEALFIVDGVGRRLYVAVQGGIYESVDGATSWSFVKESLHFGGCNTFKNGTINGEAHVLAGCGAGIANIPSTGGEWSLIPPGGLSRSYFSVSDSLGSSPASNSVVAVCMGVLHIGTIINKTAVRYACLPRLPRLPRLPT